MASGYVHSELFAVLKKTDEAIKENLTSAQYLHTLDYFLWNALEPILLECPQFFMNYLAKCVAYQFNHQTTKLTSDGKQKLPLLFAMALVEEDPRVRIIHLKKMRFNRGVLFGLIVHFLRFGDQYIELHSGVMELSMNSRTVMENLETVLGAETPSRLYSVVNQTTYWVQKARDWRAMIVEKFTRMAILQAQKVYVDYNHQLPLDDISQIALVIAGQAVDRCDSRLGVLTVFIQNWLKSVRAEVKEEIEFQSNDSLDELQVKLGDTLTIASVGFDSSSDELETIAYQAKLADPDGLIRLHLGIPEHISGAERTRLQDFVLI